jgi:hypothetical protein
MTIALGHEHFPRRRFRELVRAVFPQARFGAYEAHYVPGSDRGLRPFRPFLSYNFAIT